MLTPDRIHLRDYEVLADIGVFQSERGQPQRLLFSVDVELTDRVLDLDDQVDRIMSYDLLVQAIDSALASQRYNLLETLAETIAGSIKSRPRVRQVTVRIEKLDRVPGALGVSVTRSASDAGAPVKLDPVDFLIWPGYPVDVASGLVILPDHSPDWSGEPRYARQIALLEIEQAAWSLGAALNLDVVRTRTELAAAADQRQQVVWAPVRLVSDAPTVSPAPLSLVAWLTTQLDITQIHVPSHFGAQLDDLPPGAKNRVRRLAPAASTR